MYIGVDTGGTFTDFVIDTGKGIRFHKVLSTPQDPAEAILRGIAELGISTQAIKQLIHGSTVATNAILERKGVRTMFITNQGMEDMIAIGRQTRARLYDLCPPVPRPWTKTEDCLGVSARTDSYGKTISPLSDLDILAIQQKAPDYESVAICLLFSFLDPKAEREIADVIPKHIPVSISSHVLPEYREYERASTTFLNAYVSPKVIRYLNQLGHQLGSKNLLVMHSAGGVMRSEDVANNSVRMVLSGPAGGLAAAQNAGKDLGLSKIITFDMGGTSTDVALIDGTPRITTEGHIANLPIAVPMLDIHTIGAGGGSIAWIDVASLLHVGPESAGARPGPACYGRGGKQPTVTDANVLLGRLPANILLGGSIGLDIDASHNAMSKVASDIGLDSSRLAEGIIRITEEKMAGAIRTVSEQRGYDPREFTLMCFGGAGGLHCCALAERMRIRQIVVPIASGAFSALGMLCSHHRLDASRSRSMNLYDPDIGLLNQLFEEMELENTHRMPGKQLKHHRLVDLRYAGQGSTLSIPWQENIRLLVSAFEERHEREFGHRLDEFVEVLTLRVSTIAETPAISLPVLQKAKAIPISINHSPVDGHGVVSHYLRSDLFPGHELHGPAFIVESTSTIWLAPAWTLTVAESGHLLLDYGDNI